MLKFAELAERVWRQLSENRDSKLIILLNWMQKKRKKAVREKVHQAAEKVQVYENQ